MYALARFNAWVTACRSASAAEMKAAKEETMGYFVSQYRAMLSDNLDEYADDFDSYTKPPQSDS